MKMGQVLLGAVLSLSVAGACNKDDRAQARVDQAKEEAKELKDRAERRTEQAKEALDHRLDETKAAADRHVDEVKEAAKDTRDDVRHNVRGTDDDTDTRWRSSWDRFWASPTARWSGDDRWVVEHGDKGEVRAHRRDLDRSAHVDDSAITASVKDRLAADGDVRGSDIDVDTHDGEVTLKGTAASGTAAGEAVRLALATRGVTKVTSKLTVNK